MNFQTIKESVDKAHEAIKSHKDTVNKLEAGIVGLQLLCSHDWQFESESYHGSDEGAQYFVCRACGLEEKRG